METARQLITEYGILAVVIGAFFEGELIVFSAGILAAKGILNPVEVWIGSASGAWFGHVFWFYLGRFFKKHRFVWLIPGWRKNLRVVNRFIRNYRWRSVVFLQYVYGIRLLGAIAFGLTRISAVWFISAQILNCLVWAFLIEYLGYSLGGMFNRRLLTNLKYLWIIASVILILFIIHHLVRKELKLYRNNKGKE